MLVVFDLVIRLLKQGSMALAVIVIKICDTTVFGRTPFYSKSEGKREGKGGRARAGKLNNYFGLVVDQFLQAAFLVL